MKPEIWVSPDGATTEVTTPTVAVRMRARGWVPAAEAQPNTPPYDKGGTLPPAAQPTPKPSPPRRKPTPKSPAEAPAPATTPDES